MGVLWLLTIAIICHSTTSLKASMPVRKNNIDNSLRQSQTNTSLTETSSNVTIRNTTNGLEDNVLREKRGTFIQDSDLDKRAQKVKFSSWAGKRADDLEEDKRAKFSSWGGKRGDDDFTSNIDDNIHSIKRAKFSSWGGKRDSQDDDMDKRAKFSSWAGKRDGDDITEDKRTKFNSWAGKRDQDAWDDKRAKFSSWAGKRGKFNSWAGKRSDLDINSEETHGTFAWEDKPELEPNYFSEDKRAKFSSWAGKRSPDYIGNSWNKMTPDNRLKYYTNGLGETSSENIMKLWQDLMSRKRARFSSWAGKRSDEAAGDTENLEHFLDSLEEEKRAKFSSWAGKREDGEKRKFSSWGGKRDGEIVKRSVWPSGTYKRKPVFSSWGGKRSQPHSIQARSVQRPLLFINSGTKTRPWGTLMRPIRKQPEFYPWGGKRST